MIQVQFNREPVIRFLADGRNQRWLAKQSGVSEAIISRLLNCPTPAPRTNTVERLARVIGCRPLELYIEVETETATN